MIAYLVVDESSVLALSSVVEHTSLGIVAYFPRVFVHQIEGISRKLGPASAFALHQEGVIWAWNRLIRTRVHTMMAKLNIRHTSQTRSWDTFD